MSDRTIPASEVRLILDATRGALIAGGVPEAVAIEGLRMLLDGEETFDGQREVLEMWASTLPSRSDSEVPKP